MGPITLTEINVDEALRYMGCPPDKADAATRGMAEECAQALLAAIRPRWAWREFALSFEEGGVRLAGGLLLPGADLKKHLLGCKRCAVFCATLSAGADALIRRAEGRDMAKAFALDCCAAAAVEQVCDRIEEYLQSRYPGCSFPFRYSPGYGDLPLAVQNGLLALLDAPRRVGLCATDSHILTPRKSVTAILGVSEGKTVSAPRDCARCPARAGCQYRKAGGHCGLL